MTVCANVLFIGNCVYGKNASTVEDLKELLASNPDMLERFIVEAVSLETLERWLQKKTEMMNLPSRLTSGKNKLADWKVITVTMTMTMFVLSTQRSPTSVTCWRS